MQARDELMYFCDYGCMHLCGAAVGCQGLAGLRMACLRTHGASQYFTSQCLLHAA